MRVLSLVTERDALEEFGRIGADPAAFPVLRAKTAILAIKLEGLRCSTAGILKQTALALGADCAVHRDIVRGRKAKTDTILLASRRQLSRLVERLREQPPGARQVATDLTGLMARWEMPSLRLVFGPTGTRVRAYDLACRTYLMGVLNVTPDSFSDGGRFLEPEAAVRRGQELVEQGADFLDIGAESTRPGAEPVRAKVELARLLPVLRPLRRLVKVPISIDTTKAAVARVCLEAGADMVNDVSGLRADPNMAAVIARNRVPCVIMHMRGTPRTMQRRPRYHDLMAEIYAQLEQGLVRARQAGIGADKILVDPGIGFGKTVDDNFTILRRLAELKSLGRPVLIGPSRKSFIGLTLNLPPEMRLEGTLAACVAAVQAGANVLRVHDVSAVKRTVVIADRVLGRGV